MTSNLCMLVTLVFDFFQNVFDVLFGLIGQAAPTVTQGIGSVFGCNL